MKGKGEIGRGEKNLNYTCVWFKNEKGKRAE
jgi:hypothetical protein